MSGAGPAAGWLPIRLIRGILAGFLAGVAFMALNSWFDTTMGKPPLAPFMAVASLAQGPAAAMQHTATIWYGMAIHSVLSALFGVIFVVAIQIVRLGNASVALAGFVYGGLIYAIDFQIFARFVPQFHALTMTNQPLELAVHLVFGSLLALLVLLRTSPRRPPGSRFHTSSG
jgi:hypothetical protein